MWELAVVGCLLLFITWIAMQKTKKFNEFSTYQSAGRQQLIDTDELAQKIAREIIKELRAILQEQSLTTKSTQSPTHRIAIDESVIPTSLTLEVEASGMEAVVKEEKVIDKGIEKSKSKLASVLKRKEK